MSTDYIESAVIDMDAKDGPTITLKLNQEGLNFRFYLFGLPGEIVTNGLEVMDLRSVLEKCPCRPYRAAVPESDGHKVLILTYPVNTSSQVLSDSMVALADRLNQVCRTRNEVHAKVTKMWPNEAGGQLPAGEDVVYPWTHDRLEELRQEQERQLSAVS